MLWNSAKIIEHNRLALLRLVAGLFVQAGITPAGEGVANLPRSVRSAIFSVLRKVESATRRLVFAEAQDLDIPEYVTPHKRNRAPRNSAKADRKPSTRLPLFRLNDPRVFYEELYPHRKPRSSKPRRERRTERVLLFRMSSFDGRAPMEVWAEPDPEILPDDPMTAVSICRRLQAVHHALTDLPKQAQRMVREIAKRRAAPPGPSRMPPLRTGHPPGHCRKPTHEVDTILHDCHWLARDLENARVGV